MSTLLDQQTEVHVQLGNGAPAFLPTAIGQHYIDIANRRVYQSVGINSVEDWALPLATLKDVQELDLVSDKADVGLGNVEDYGVASQSEAELGQANDRYMTPLRVTQLLDALFMPVLDTFMARRDNPHQVTAEQVGALTSEATQLLLDEKLAEGDLAGLLQAFWAEKVGTAPETLDTIQEIAAALQNNPEVIDALQALVEGNRLSIVEAMDAIAALQALVGESTAFLTAESDLGVNPVALTGDEGGARDLKAILEGMVAKDDQLQDEIGRIEEKVDANAVSFGVSLGNVAQNLQNQIDNKVAIGGKIDNNVVTDGEVESTLASVIAQLKSDIAQAGDASDLEALQSAFNAFVAAKATAAEIVEGSDNVKYVTALAVRGAIDQAVAELVGTAPEALDTIQELAEALQNNPDVIAGLVDQIATKETPEGAQAKADAALVEAKAYADTTAASSVEAAQLYSDSTTQALIDELNRLAAEIEGPAPE